MKANLPTPLQIVFLASKVNGALYLGETLRECPHAWPKTTWFQRRLESLRAKQSKEAERET